MTYKSEVTLSNPNCVIVDEPRQFARAALASAELIVGQQENVAIGVVAVDNVADIKRQMEQSHAKVIITNSFIR